MNLNPFAKPEVIMETDTATPGTPFRVCTFRVTGKACRGDCIQRVRAALQMLISGCEVDDLARPTGAGAERFGQRFSLRYYGAQVPSDRIKSAVEKAL